MAAAGDEIGRFKLIRKLGDGTFGVVWLAADREGWGTVAVKLLHARWTESERIMERFAREARLLERLDHPRIPKPVAWDVGTGRPYLALEFAPGESLRREMHTRSVDGRLYASSEVLEIFGQLCDAVAHAHALGIVHRDLKPENAMVERSDDGVIVRVVDFGVAKILELDIHEATTAGRTLGTLTYLSPEQIDGSTVDDRTDVFALGTILFELLTLRRAWLVDEMGAPLRVREPRHGRHTTNAHAAVIHRIRAADRPAPSRYAPHVPAVLDSIVARALHSETESRFQSVAELANAVRSALEAAPYECVVDSPLAQEEDADLVAPDRPSGDALIPVSIPPTLTPVMPVDHSLHGPTGEWATDTAQTTPDLDVPPSLTERLQVEGAGAVDHPGPLDTMMVEPAKRATRPLWVWVGVAVVGALLGAAATAVAVHAPPDAAVVIEILPEKPRRE